MLNSFHTEKDEIMQNRYIHVNSCSVKQRLDVIRSQFMLNNKNSIRSSLVISKLLSKCLVKLHSNKRTLKLKFAFREQVSWLCLLSEVTSDAILDTANRSGKSNDEITLLIH